MSKRILIILITLITLIPVIIININLISRIKQRTLENFLTQYNLVQDSIGQQTALLLQSQFSNLQDKLTTIALLDEIRFGDTETCIAKLEEVANSLQVKINNLGRIGADGKFTCSVNRTLVGVPGSNLGTYVTEIFNDPEHKPVLSRRISVPNVEGYLVALHVPVFDEQNKFIGTLGGAVYFNDLRDRFLEEINLAEAGYITLTDNNGDFLYNPISELNGQNFDGELAQELTGHNEDLNRKMRAARDGQKSSLTYTLRGEARTGVLVPVEIFPDRYWVIGVIVPTDAISTAINSNTVEALFNWVIFVTILFILLTPLIVLAYLITQVFNPINRVVNSMTKVSSGDLNERVKYRARGPRDEIGILVNAFNNMLQKLNHAYSALEEKVRQRTIELEKAKSGLEEQVAERTKELADAKTDLEQKVASRTQELESKVQELERFNKVSIDRELKMIELKKTVSDLKAKLQK